MNEPFSFYRKIAEYVTQRAPFSPEIGLILGSGLSGLAQELEAPVEIPYAEIPGFLVSTAPGHAGKLIFGKVAGKRVVCMSGRFHYYEGYDFEQLSLPIRLFQLIGVKTAILTNAAGGVNESYRVGDVMLIADHIKLNGASPLRGKNLPEFGERFFDTTKLYTPSLRALALECAEGSGLNVHEGVYFYMPGPQFETPAEIRAIRILGGDAVGMSTVTEALTAAHCRMPVLAMSLITNMAAGITGQSLSGEEVNEAGDRASRLLLPYMKKIIGRITL